MAAAIKLEKVSRRFYLHHHKARSLQDALVNFVYRRNEPAEEFWALRDVSFEVRRGETLGIIGQNGSGKSTILKLITRILEPTRGRVSVDGMVSALIELGAGFHSDLTGRENVFLNGAILGISKREMRRRFDEIVAFSELERFIDTPVKHYSSGMYMRLGFSVAINVDPDILIIDEVLSVGDEAFQRKCMERIGEFRRKGKTILFVSHALGAVENLCDRVIWLDRGVVRAQGSAVQTIRLYLEELQRRDQELREHEHHKLAGATVDGAVVATAPIWTRPEPKVLDVQLADPDDRETYSFRTGDDLVARVRYRLADPEVPHALNLALRRSDGLLIHQFSYVLAAESDLTPEGVGTVEIELPELSLLAGTYDLVATIQPDDPDSTVPLPEERAARFSVWCDRKLSGLVALAHRRRGVARRIDLDDRDDRVPAIR